MKKIRRFTALLLAMVIGFSLGAAALAADIGTGTGDNIFDFTHPETPVATGLTVHFKTDENQGDIDGQKIISVYPNAIIPEDKIPNVINKDGWRFIGWLVENEEENGIVDMEHYHVKKSITMIAQYAPTEVGLLNKVDHLVYMNGDDVGTFRPDDNMTRAEAATVFYNLLLNKNVPQTKSFTDVPANAWYKDAVMTLASLGIIGGYPDGTFRPTATITRAEFAAIASRFDALSAGNVSFPDVPASHWAYKYISSAAVKGWVGGYPDGTFKPDDKITRAAVAKITNGVLERQPDEQFINSNPVRRFTDLENSHWAYFQIMEASNAHTYAHDGGREVWTNLLG